jgi:beta-lactamase superfamily II metal-dependent hydrolase
MSNELLVRAYDVGFGDCLFVRIPDDDGQYCMLIDSGTSGAGEPLLENILEDVKSLLPDDEDDPSKKCLDLLVATHPHADHIKGFDPDWFEDVRIRHIWMTAFMKEDHPQAKGARALRDLADSSARSLFERGLSLLPQQASVLSRSIWNPGALKALRETLPDANNIEPLYVARDVASVLSVSSREAHSVSYWQRTTNLNDFRENGTRLRVLAPEWNIDEYYLGKESATPDYELVSGLKERVRSDSSGSDAGAHGRPKNISARDFRVLRERCLCSALSFAKNDDSLKNNTSVVLLLEWRGRRLLFSGDAEWMGKEVETGRKNGAWDVLLKMDQDYGHLSEPLDFLKVGHHGSVNGTPFINENGAAQPALDAMLPVGGDALAVVSTLAGEHGKEFPVPYPPLVAELGRRIGNACVYSDDHDLPDTPQLLRTDYEGTVTETGVYAIDLTLEPAPDWNG